jgi:hypothetical protein
MNFSTFRSVLFGTLVLAALPYAHATVYTTVDISPIANQRLQDFNSAYPSGSPVLLDGVPFAISPIGNNIFSAHIAANGAAGTVTRAIELNMANVEGVYTLMNTFWGEKGSGTRASLSFSFSDGASLVKQLDGNVDIRDYYQNTFTNTLNGTTSVEVFSTDNNGGAGPNLYRLDRQYVSLASFAGKTLVSMTLTDTGAPGVQRVFLSGVTVAAVPEPPVALLMSVGALSIVWRLRASRELRSR